ncbi:sulfatase [Pontibacter sp. E15-1]|uniref:sulfatase n=1 Tax=Pontibacter sp. E15-1 TaxID=2919918 RepID=UPI001F4F6C9C|nr:sulfatase [Pontibacter sp. E15-1]MCJ8163950.1 sulfatase [Pontibacter sp. E15-1]
MMKRISCLAISFMLVLLYVRTLTYGLAYSTVLQSKRTIKEAVFIAYEDLLLILGIWALFVVISLLFGKKAAIQKAAYGVYASLLLLALVWSLINIEAVKILNTPVNYQLLYNSNLNDSQFIVDSIAEGISWGILLKILLLCALAVGAGELLYALARKIKLTGFVTATMATAVAAGLGYYMLHANLYIEELKQERFDDYGKVANPVVAFAASFGANMEEHFMTRDFPVDSLRAYRPIQNKGAIGKPSEAPFHPKVKNVILFVMESVPAEYVAGYQDTYNVTPVLKKHFAESLVISDCYAHSPASVNSIFSMLGSAYPAISIQNVVNEHPDLRWPTLSSELKEKQYRTAFYGFSDLSYMNVDRYLAHRGFDVVVDHKNTPCATTFKSDSEGAETGKDEACMVDGFLNWVDEEEGQDPFFAVLWTMQTHWPYFVSGNEKTYVSGNEDFNRYLNALHYSDAVLGNLLDGLKQKGLAESTVVVVLGDHGEAFGRHGQYGHGSSIYEENIRIPLIFINPLLFCGQQKQAVGGLVDLPVTVMDLLHEPSPTEWIGTSLFDSSRDNTTYFFSTWSGYLYGYRSGDYKVIFNAGNNKTSVFDLKKDPREETDIASKIPALVNESHDRLGYWVGYNRALLGKAISNTENTTALR